MTTIADIYRQYCLDLAELAPRYRPAGDGRKTRRRIRLICRECACSLMGYQANEYAEYRDGTCGVCNRERRVADPKLFQLTLR